MLGGNNLDLSQVPQWVNQNFVRSALAIGATADKAELEQQASKLIKIWCAPERFQHGISHLLEMLARFDVLASETPHADCVRIAAWYHGVVFSTSDQNVYTRNGGEDEQASAEFAVEELNRLGVPEEAVNRIKKLITGLKVRGVGECKPSTESGARHVHACETSTLEAVDIDQQALRDAHLGTLAVEPQKYRKYGQRLRQEYAHVPLRHFITSRIQIIQKLLSRKKLFVSPLASAWEEVARQNLISELSRLEHELQELDSQISPSQSVQTMTMEIPAVANEENPHSSLAALDAENAQQAKIINCDTVRPLAMEQEPDY
ncbi:MAG: hypothetical protein SPG61_02920 [Arcanobacterium sp.]|nr:hypothetical protein [Arcanobacterium sp.]